jgi:hypothetical protein
MMRDRNLTSHTYREVLALAVYRRLPEHLALLEKLHRTLRSV